MRRNYWLPLILAIVFAVGIWLGSIINTSRSGLPSFLMSESNRSKAKGKAKLNSVLDLIYDNYVDPVDMDSLVEMAIPSLLDNLDPHSSYIPTKDYEKSNSELEGKFSGIGISFQIVNDTLSVVEVISGGPAEKVGMLAGDRIIKVDDKDIANTQITEDDVFGLLRGDKGTHVNITVKRNNSKTPINFEITRDDIPVESIDAAYMVAPEIGYIKISRFARNTFQEFFLAINRLRIDGAKDIIVDLRGNGGGYMEPALLMSNEFLPAGADILSTKSKNPTTDQMVKADGSGAFQDFGLCVIVNEFTASASEIFTGAIQDNDRGWVVGRRTFGKGLVQSPILLPDSSEVRLTIQRYYTPSGRSIQKDYKPGANYEYEQDLAKRFSHGESFSADSIKFDESLKYLTVGGRTVYGGGGIMPDIFVPEDTTGINSYYINIVNHSLPQKYAYEYCDLNRDKLQKATTVAELLEMLPSDYVIRENFANYAALNGINKKPRYLNESQELIVSLVKAHIARNILGISSFYEVLNPQDNAIQEAIRRVQEPLNVK